MSVYTVEKMIKRYKNRRGKKRGKKGEENTTVGEENRTIITEFPELGYNKTIDGYGNEKEENKGENNNNPFGDE